MARILHTADLHLAEDHPERWDALDAVLATAGERDVDVVLVAGDLLDRGEDHAALRGRLRGILDEAPCPVVVLPGNHDREAYAPGQDWGERTRVMLSEPVHVLEAGGVRLAGVPFPSDAVPFAGVRRRVAERVREEGAAVLALHGTLIDASAPHIQVESREDEPDDRYFSVRTGELAGLEVAYVALGHYHQHDLRRAGGVPVAYSGSPSPVGSNAWGPRKVVLVETGDPGATAAEVEAVDLDVPYRDRIARWLTPFREREELDALADALRRRADARCTMTVELDGVLAGMAETEVAEALEELGEELGGAFAGLTFDRDAVGLDPARADLFREFRRRLDDREVAGDHDGERLRHRTLEIAARALKG